MITLERLLTELKPESLNEIIAGCHSHHGGKSKKKKKKKSKKNKSTSKSGSSSNDCCGCTGDCI